VLKDNTLELKDCFTYARKDSLYLWSLQRSIATAAIYLFEKLSIFHLLLVALLQGKRTEEKNIKEKKDLEEFLKRFEETTIETNPM